MTGRGKKEAPRVGESRASYSPTPPRRDVGQRAGLWALYFLWALFFVSYYFLLADPLLALSKRSLRLAKRLAGRLAERWASRLARRLASGGRVGRESGAGR